MKSASSRRTVDCDVETFWKTFFDPEYTRRLYLEALGFKKFEILEQTETLRRTRGVPKLNMPKPVVSLLGDSFGFDEEGRFDPAAQTFRWKLVPNTLRDKLRNEGSVRVESAGP